MANSILSVIEIAEKDKLVHTCAVTEISLFQKLPVEKEMQYFIRSESE